MVMAATSIEHPEIPPVKGVTRGHLYVRFLNILKNFFQIVWRLDFNKSLRNQN